MKKLNAFIKYLLSFFKSNWEFDDYPLETWLNPNAQQEDIQYGAMFTNWSAFVAHGRTKNEAIGNLRKNFDQYRKENKLPRPGSKVPLRFASTNRIDQFEEIAVDFFNRIIEKDYYNCFISDLSSLHDFGLGDNETLNKIKSEYGIEPEGEDLFFVDIFQQIKDKK